MITPEVEIVVAPVALGIKDMWNHAWQPALVGLFCACTAQKYAHLNDQIVSVLTQRVPD
ncbi:capsule biosynthesis GfcC family protein [Escherichia coli]